jgi:hypothetical protein
LTFVVGQAIAREENVVASNLHLHVVRRRWSRGIHDEVRVFRRGMRLSIDEAQAVNLYP